MNSLLYKISPFIVGTAVLVFTNTVHAEAQILTLEQAKTMVLASAQVSARSEYVKAKSFMPEQVGSLPDPILSLGALSFPVDTFDRGQENMTQLQVGISQALPFPGKLGQLEASASYMAQAAAYDLDELKLQLLSQVQVRWWNIFYADRALEILEKNNGLLHQFIRIAETKYKTGKGLQQDVLLAQLELSKLLDNQIQWVSIRDQEQVQLNALLNQSASQTLVLSRDVDESLPTLIAEDKLIKQAFNARPMLAQQAQYIRSAQAQVNVAEKDFYPDFKLGASYGFRQANPVTGLDRTDLASITLSMSIPFGESQDAKLGQRQAEAAQAEFNYQDVREKVSAEVAVEVANYARAKQQVSLFKQGIIPQAQQTVASMLAAYQVNKVDFLNLVRTQMTLYNYETQYWKVLAQAKQSLARLDAVVGKTVEISHE